MVPGKEGEPATESDADALFKYADGKSDVTRFARNFVKKLDARGKIDRQTLVNYSVQLHWLAGNLFGAETARVVVRIVELEAQALNDRDALEYLYRKGNKINKLSDEAKETLILLRDGIQAKHEEEHDLVPGIPQLVRKPDDEENVPAPIRRKPHRHAA
jgi:hypothetical protein